MDRGILLIRLQPFAPTRIRTPLRNFALYPDELESLASSCEMVGSWSDLDMNDREKVFKANSNVHFLKPNIIQAALT